MHLVTIALLALEEGGHGGGFNPFDPSGIGGIFWTWIIFLGALAPIWIQVMGPITRAMSERDRRAIEAIAAAKRASEEAEAARAQVEIKLGEARAEAQALLAQARERAAAREQQMIEEAGERSREMVDAARRAIEAEKQKAVSAIRDEVVELSLAGAEAVIGRRVSGEDDKRLVGELVDRMRGAHR